MRVSGAMTIRLGRSRSPMRTGVKRGWTDMTAELTLKMLSTMRIEKLVTFPGQANVVEIEVKVSRVIKEARLECGERHLVHLSQNIRKGNARGQTRCPRHGVIGAVARPPVRQFNASRCEADNVGLPILSRLNVSQIIFNARIEIGSSC